jgi:hypothetical protein
MDCNDDCNGGLNCKNNTKVSMEKVEVRHAKDSKGRGLFAMGILKQMNMS